MYTKDEILEQKAQEGSANLRNKREYKEGDSVETIIANIDKLRVDLFIKGIPNTVFKYTEIVDESTGKTEKLNINVRPSNNEKLQGVRSSTVIELDLNENIYNDFINKYAKWLDNYLANAKLVHNVAKLEADLTDIIKESGIELGFDLKFELGTGLIDISDNHIIVGITPTVAQSLSTNLMYDAIELRKNAYRGRIVDFLSEVTGVMDIFRLDSQFTRDLGLRNRKSLYSMIRAFVTRRVEFLRTGVGYYEKDSVFAIVERIAIKESEVEAYTEAGYLIHDNTKPSLREKEAERTKIASHFKLSPLTKSEQCEKAEVSLETILVN